MMKKFIYKLVTSEQFCEENQIELNESCCSLSLVDQLLFSYGSSGWELCHFEHSHEADSFITIFKKEYVLEDSGKKQEEVNQ